MVSSFTLSGLAAFGGAFPDGEQGRQQAPPFGLQHPEARRRRGEGLAGLAVRSPFLWISKPLQGIENGQVLAAALKENRQVTEIDLSMNGFGDVGAEVGDL